MLATHIASRRRGTTLPELIVALAAFTVVAGAVFRVMLAQYRWVRTAADASVAHAASRGALGVMFGQLRTLAPAAGDIYAVSANAVDIRSLVGVSVACDVTPAGGVVVLPPDRSASGIAYSAWIAPPRAGDSVLVYDAGVDSAAADDRWTVHELSRDPAPRACPASNGFTSPADAAGLTLALSPALPPTVGVGAAVRVVRRAHYAFARSSDGLWYLAFSECDATRAPPCSAPQPVVGPIDPTASWLRFFDGSGALTMDPASVRTIDIRIVGRGRGDSRDSLASSVSPRN